MSRIAAAGLCLATSLVLATGPALAVPPEVQNLRWTSKSTLAWDPTGGTTLGYHLYGGDLDGLPGNAVCLIGSNPTETVRINEAVAPGAVRYYLAAAFDGTGRSTLGNESGGAERVPLDECIPARRTFPATRDGDQGDGVIDGDYPLRNPSAMTRRTKRETTGVFLHTGEFFLTATDLAIPGRHLDWSFQRTYRSQVDYDGPLGHNWDFMLNARLIPLGTDVTLHEGNGRAEVFLRTSPTTFDSPAGRYDVLIENPDGSFTLRGPHGLLRNFHAFDSTNVEGALESVEDRFGDVVTLAYDHQGLLTVVTDGLGRRVDYEYDDAGRLTSVTDFDGRSLAFGYDAAGDLVSARSPVVTGTPTGNDFPAGKTTTYTYSSGFADPRFNHCLLTITNPNEQTTGGPVWGNVAYFTGAAPAFDQGRVDTWTIGGTNATGIPAGGTIDFSYESLNSGFPPDPITQRRRTTVVDRNGNLREYVHNHAGNRLEQTLFTNREVRPGEPDYTTSYAYNSDGELVQAVYPAGNRTLYTYDAPGLDRYREGNLLELRRVADDLAGGGRGDGHGSDSNDLVTTYEYDPVYNLVRRQTEPRGNDPAYVPQNGGAATPDRYSIDTTYCHQEGDPALTGLTDYASRFGIDLTGFAGNLGDVNGDGVTDSLFGNPVRVELPEVALDPASNQAGIEGDTSQDGIISHAYNPFGQRISTTDPEGNVHEYAYHPENDPDGDGTPTPTPPDGRTLDGGDGGYLASNRNDTTGGAGRNNGTDPPPADVEVTYEYDAVGNVIAVVDGRGVLTRYVRNALNQVVLVRRGAATFDAPGPGGDPPTGRGEAGLVAPGFEVEFEYDANNNVTAIRREDRDQDHGAGTRAEECLIWDLDDGSVGAGVEFEANLTLRTDFRYDKNRNVVQVIRPEGNTDEIQYDERDLVFRTTQGATGPRGGVPVVRSYDYDANGNLVRVTDGRGNPTDLEHDGHDRTVRVIDQVGNTLEHFYDPVGQVVRALHRGPVGGPTPPDRSGVTNVDLRDVAYLWDERRRVFRIDEQLFVPAGAAPGRPPVITEGPLLPGDGAINTILEYDRNDRPSFLLRDSGATVRTDYDGVDRVLRGSAPDGSTLEYAYDAQHNLVETAETELSTSPGPPSELFLTTYFYDALGRRVERVDNVGNTTRWLYSSLDAAIKISDPNGPPGPTINRRSSAGAGMTSPTNLHGNVTDYAYDAAGRLLRVDRILTASGLGDGTPTPAPTSADPNNTDGLVSVHYDWDGNSLRLQSQDDELNTTTYSYDNLDRLVSRTEADGTSATYLWNEEHNLAQHDDANGSSAGYSYDDANRLTQITVVPAADIEGTTLETYEYDGLGRITRATDGNDPADTGDDAVVRRIYDSLGRAVEEKQGYGTGPGAEKLIDVRWTADMLPVELVYPTGRQVQYGYDAQDRLRTIDDAARAETADYDWFGMGRLHTRAYGNGVRMTMLNDAGTLDEGYDGIRRIVRLRHLDAAGGVLAGFEHRYDNASNRLDELRLHHPDPASGGTRGELYAFDSANRLVDFQEGALDSSLNLVGPALDAQSWELDGVGNWVRVTRNGTAYDFTPNNLNEHDEPQSGGARTDDGLADDAWDDASIPGPDGQNRAHDKNGNRTADGRLQYVYDYRNRLRRLVDSGTGAPVAEYDYDALGRRVSRVVSNSGSLNETRRYLYTPDVMVYEAPGVGIAGIRQETLNNKYPENMKHEVREHVQFMGSKLDRAKIELQRSVNAGAARKCISPLCGGYLIEQRDAVDAVAQQVVYGPGGPVWQLPADGSSQYLHEDPRGNVVLLTEGAGSPMAAAGDVLERVTYDPFGKPVFQDAANIDKTEAGGTFLAQSDLGNRLLFQGRWYDPESGARGTTPKTDFGGMYARGLRYLDPDDGRYVSRFADGDPDRPIITGRVYTSGRYATGVGAPVSAGNASGPMPQTREHILLARQVGVPAAAPRDAASGMATGKRQHKPIPAMPTTPTTRGWSAATQYFVADSFSFAVEREMKESGEKGGTEDMNIGIGELQECSVEGEFWFEDLHPGWNNARPSGVQYRESDFSMLGRAMEPSAAGPRCCGVSCSCPPPPGCCGVSCSCQPPSGHGFPHFGNITLKRGVVSHTPEWVNFNDSDPGVAPPTGPVSAPEGEVKFKMAMGTN